MTQSRMSASWRVEDPDEIFQSDFQFLALVGQIPTSNAFTGATIPVVGRRACRCSLLSEVVREAAVHIEVVARETCSTIVRRGLSSTAL